MYRLFGLTGLLRQVDGRLAPARRRTRYARRVPGPSRGRETGAARAAHAPRSYGLVRQIGRERRTTRSPRSTTRGAGASSRTCRSTSRRRARRAGRWSSSASAPGGSRSRSPPAGIRVIGVDSSPGCSSVCREQAELAGVATSSTSASATSATRRSTSACRSSSARSAPPAPARRRRAARRRSRPRASCSLPGGRLVFDVFTPGARRHRRDARPLDRARAGDLRARRLGRAGAHADPVRARPERRDDDDARLALAGRVARPARAGGLRGRGLLRLVRPAPVRAAARTRSGSRRRAVRVQGPRRQLGPDHRIVVIVVVLLLFVLVGMYNGLVRQAQPRGERVGAGGRPAQAPPRPDPEPRRDGQGLRRPRARDVRGGHAGAHGRAAGAGPAGSRRRPRTC